MLHALRPRDLLLIFQTLERPQSEDMGLDLEEDPLEVSHVLLLQADLANLRLKLRERGVRLLKIILLDHFVERNLRLQQDEAKSFRSLFEICGGARLRLGQVAYLTKHHEVNVDRALEEVPHVHDDLLLARRPVLDDFLQVSLVITWICR